MEYADCILCNGAGIDDADWSGRCFRCGGSGQVQVDDHDDADQREDDA